MPDAVILSIFELSPGSIQARAGPTQSGYPFEPPVSSTSGANYCGASCGPFRGVAGGTAATELFSTYFNQHGGSLSARSGFLFIFISCVAWLA